MKQFLRHIFLILALFMATASAWAQNPVYKEVNGVGAWYSLYDTEQKNNTTVGTTFCEKAVFAPAESMTFDYKKFTGISFNGKLQVQNKVNGNSWSDSKGEVSYSSTSWNTSQTISLDANISHIRYRMPSGTGASVRNHFVKLKKHILLNDNTTNGQTWGVSSIKLTDNSLATAEGKTSTNYYTIKFRSFLASGNITIKSDNSEFHFGSGATSISLNTANNYFARIGGTASKSSTNPADQRNVNEYETKVYFSPAVQYNKNTRSTTITISDGTSTAYIYLSAPVIPTYFFKVEAVASPAEGGTATATFPNEQNAYSLVAPDYATASMSAKVTFTATPNTTNGYVFEGWKTDPASSTFYKQGADQTSFTETITSSALNPNELKSQLTYYAIYSRRYTAKITGSNYSGILVNESWPADYQFVNTQTAKPTKSEADPFYFVIDHDFTGNDTREGSPRPNEVIAYDPTTNKITALNEGTATITFYQKNTDSHEPVSESFTVQVIKHTPVFTLNPAVTNSPEKLYFNKEYPNYFTTTANSPLTITSSDELVAKWVPGSNAQSYTLQTFSKTNTATLTAIQHENYYWARLEGSIDIQLQDPNNHVPFTIDSQDKRDLFDVFSNASPYTWDNGIQMGNWEDGGSWDDKYVDLYFTGVPNKLGFSTSVKEAGIFPASGIYWYVKESEDGVNWSSEIWNNEGTKNITITDSILLNPKTRYVRLCYSGNFGCIFHNVTISELNQFEAIDANEQKVTAIDFGKDQHVDAEQRRTFNFRYANAGYNVKFEVVSDTPENTANAKKYITLSHNDFVTLNGEKYLTSIGGEKSGTVENITVQLYSKEDEYVIPANTKIKISDEVGHTYYVSLSGNIVRANQTLSWQGLFLKDPVMLPLTTGTFSNVAKSSNDDLPITYESSNLEVITISNDGKTLTPIAEGEVVITAKQEGNHIYNPATPITRSVVVTGKKVQVIIWESSLSDLQVGDEPVTLTAKAYWIDMENDAQLVYSEEQTSKIRFTSNNPSIVSIEGNVLTIHAAGSTTVKAFVPGNETYKEDQQVIPVRVRPATTWCDDVLLLNNPDEYEFFIFDLNRPELISSTYEIDHSKGVPGTLEFQHTGKPWTLAIEYYGGTIHAQQSIDGSTWTTVATVTPTKNATNISEGSLLDRQAKYIRFVRAQGGIGYHYVSNIKVHPAQYIEPSQEVIDFSTVQYGSQNTFTFDVAYSNIKYQLSPKTSASDVQVSPQSFGACGAFGTQTITGTWTPNEGGDNITRTITFTDVNTGMSATVTLKANVLKKDQFIKWEDAPAEIDDYSDIDSRPRKTLNASDEEVRDITYEIVDGTELAAFDNSMFYLKGTGDIRIRAYHNGDTEYKPVEQFYNIHIASIQPTFLGTKNQDWTIHENWVNGIQPNGSDDFVVILAPTSISGMQINVKGLQIADNGAITVTSTGGMTVGEKGVSSAKNESRISIDNTPEGAGFFRIHPVAVTNGDTPATVTVNYTTKAKSGDPRDEIWQYVGAPGNNMQMSNDGILVYHWKEQKGWLLADTKMQPFVGYALTRTTEGSNNYEIHAEPVYTDQVIQLTKTASGMNGDNLFANSYLAPIDVRKIDKDDIIDPDNKLTRTFFLFNSGSWNDWKQGAGDITAAGYDHSSAGHYYSIPFYSAKLIDDGTSQVVIPPMQGVYVYSEGEATIKFNYAKHVYGADASDLNKPMRMPQEKTWSDSFRRVRIQATSKNSGADRMYIVQEENTTSKYDNGYDGDNILAAKQVNIYTNEPFGQMEVSCSNNIDSMFIGFTAGEDSEYTLTFGAVVGKDMYLKDIEKNESILITDGGQYIFYAQPNSVNDMRFQLLLDPHLSNDNLDDDGVTTGGDNICSDITRVWINDKKLYVADVPKNTKLAVYTASGVCIATPYIIHHTPYTLDLSYLPTGVYVLRLNNQAYKFVCE